MANENVVDITRAEHLRAELMREIGHGDQAEEPKETWQSSILEALKEVDEPFLRLGSAEVYVVKSNTDDMDFYYELVFETEHGRFKVCAKCKGFRYRNKCDHVGKVP